MNTSSACISRYADTLAEVLAQYPHGRELTQIMREVDMSRSVALKGLTCLRQRGGCFMRKMHVGNSLVTRWWHLEHEAGYRAALLACKLAYNAKRATYQRERTAAGPTGAMRGDEPIRRWSRAADAPKVAVRVPNSVWQLAA